jgi:pyrimidine operon attenuation protein / uracil phosphoribosyltransferase
MKILFEKETLKRTIRRLAHEIIEQHINLEEVILVGILNKGFKLATIIQGFIEEIQQIKIPVFPLEIRPFRDDEKLDISIPPKSFVVKDKTIILVDDVLFTGRSVRAAFDAIISLGRPSKIRLVVLIDRGHRQLPIRPDIIGKNIPTQFTDLIEINFDQMTVIIKT